MVGSGASGSSGSKRKSSEAGNIPSLNPSFEHPEGRDATKKKSKGSSSKTNGRSKLVIEEEYSKIIADREVNLKQINDLDEDEQELANMLKTELFGR
ncbi:hypothetical protein LIER_13858 [Lithospermum erythrorhizon]|uniref:Uncharacterized protein n=1 Tax=Lithospermum erythrorhizon TaxID=34254 RepID=A0AAV3PYX8_LITER